MKKRLTMFFACLFLCVGSALAQTKVAGTVLSQDDGQPIIGAAVKVDGTSTGMLTKIDHVCSLTLPEEAARVAFARANAFDWSVDHGGLDRQLHKAFPAD